jgi:hypothetical protein
MKFQEILGNTKKFQETLGNTKKYQQISGNTCKFREILGNTKKYFDIFEVFPFLEKLTFFFSCLTPRFQHQLKF